MNYAAIHHYDIANGEGVRITLFVSGCHFHCPECFNQKAQSFDYGNPFDTKAEEEILRALQDTTIAGLSLLGGDPLCQEPDDIWKLVALCDKAHLLGKNIWMWSGFTWEQIFSGSTRDGAQIPRRMLVSQADVFVDGLFDKSLADRKLVWRGSANQRVIDVQASLRAGRVVVYQD